DDPIDIIAHLLIGSEGTLGFISEATYRTLPVLPCFTTGMALFPNVQIASEAAYSLGSSMNAIELMDYQSLVSIRDKFRLGNLSEGVAALLLESRSETSEDLENKLGQALRALRGIEHDWISPFSEDPVKSKHLWQIRKGLFPSLGYSRNPGSTILIEDVA